MRSHGGGSLSPSWLEGKAVVWAHAKCLPLLTPPPCLLLSFFPSILAPAAGLACQQPTVLATPVITTRVAAAEAAVVERVLYAARTEGETEGGAEEKGEHTNV